MSITFGVDSDLDGTPESTAFLERSGPDVLDGFLVCNGRDAAATGYGPQLGGCFLRSTPGAGFGVLIIDNSGGVVSAASGEIWDIDGVSQGTEQYRVRAFDSGGTLLATIDSPLSTQESGCANTELDGKPWTFNFSATPGIARITIDAGNRRPPSRLAYRPNRMCVPTVNAEKLGASSFSDRTEW